MELGEAGPEIFERKRSFAVDSVSPSRRASAALYKSMPSAPFLSNENLKGNAVLTIWKESFRYSESNFCCCIGKSNKMSKVRGSEEVKHGFYSRLYVESFILMRFRFRGF